MTKYHIRLIQNEQIIASTREFNNIAEARKWLSSLCDIDCEIAVSVWLTNRDRIDGYDDEYAIEIGCFQPAPDGTWYFQGK